MQDFWEDNNLARQFGDSQVAFDTTLTDLRSGEDATDMTLGQFLNDYRKNNWYLIDSVPKSLSNILKFPRILQTTGVLHGFQESVL